jgi:NAD(P)-dependent dehydrogenase (short-subunit alcohol dehydrogenase family)
LIEAVIMESESEYFSPYRPDGKLYGFVCIVTGANQPVGKAIATELAGLQSTIFNPQDLYSHLPAHGAACIYTCTQINQSSGLVDTLPKTYPNTKIIDYPYSISSESDTLTLIDETLNAWGRLDVWVCSSGLLGPPTIEATTPSDLQKCFEANSMAPFFALKYAPPAMAKTTPKGNYPNAAPKDRQYGSIIVVSSTASTYGGCWGPCFTMSSHAALGVVRAGVSVLKGTGVRINCISPGQIDVGVDLKGLDTRGMNAQLPPADLQSKEVQKANIGLERAGDPAEVGMVAGFLASCFSSYITGQNLVVDGGASTMCPVMVPV